MSLLLLFGDSDPRIEELQKRYLAQMQNLLPQGYAWTRLDDADLTKLLSALSWEPAQIHVRALDLINEFNPSTASESLAEWESLVGIPDDCIPLGVSKEERRNNIVAKLRFNATQSLDDYKSIAATYGYTITSVTGYNPFRVGLSAVGDALTNDSWIFAKIITMPSGANNALIICVLREHAHSHGWLDFVFT